MIEIALETEHMSNIELPNTESKTLAQRMGEGRLPVADAMRYAMQLADALRKLHDAGKSHGGLTPSQVVLTGAGLDLVPAAEGTIGAITPYTAPEVLQARPADARSDVFSFGAILFEMLSGRRAFEGEGRTTLANQLLTAATPASGSPAVDRLVGPCLVKNPEARTTRMQKLMMELKLLSVAVRRAETATRVVPRRDVVEAGTLRNELEQMEARMTARLQAHDRKLTEAQRASSEAVGALKNQVVALSADVAIASEQSAIPAAAGLDLEAAARLAALDQSMMALDRSMAALGERLAQLEAKVEEKTQKDAQFEHSVAADLVDIEAALKVQAAGIDSARVAMSQTDDLVERVVEALESLQMAVLDQNESGHEAAFAVN